MKRSGSKEAGKGLNSFEFLRDLVPEERLELSRAKAHWILSPARLPVSPLRH